MNPLLDGKYTAFIGLDWADSKHDVCVQAANSEAREFDQFPHQVECIEQWAHAMQARFGGLIAVALELSKGPIVSALQKYDCFVLFPINPTTLAKYREAFKPSRAKDDPTDAELALDLLVRHPQRFKPLKPQSVPMRTMMYLVEQRRQLIGDKGRFVNRLTNALKQYYPQALEWFEQHDTPLFCDFISRWPTLPDYAIFSALPGAGPSLTPRLMVAFGEQRDRYQSAEEMQRYSGVAPVTEHSGQKRWIHWRWQCPTFMRQTFVEWAAQTINKSFWAGAFYRQQRAKGCPRQTALRALAYKWIRILYRCWQTRTPYDESTYLIALQRRGSPLLKQLGETAQTS